MSVSAGLLVKVCLVVGLAAAAGCGQIQTTDEGPTATIGSGIEADAPQGGGDDEANLDGDDQPSAGLEDLLDLSPEELQNVDLEQLQEEGVLTPDQAEMIADLLTQEEFIERFQSDLGGNAAACPFMDTNTDNAEEICELMQQRQSGEISLEEFNELLCQYATCRGG